ncbi:amino acid adenylation domain protein (plasmid) [Gemmatirosa kalamazoonensis]|uniref:Amino acid adenylation domain protein n=2 Tax=Gemmatirosa kalamazoonensis TaxID=861299 RepID=W0RRI3_9BACT|nr:amino acid adenylation domain protein [Gemmatirosa kalamazoonensis]
MAGQSAGPEEGGIPRRATTAGDVAPMSFAQELLWLLDRAAPGLTAYNVPRAIRVRGALDAEALRGALDTVVARHELLRTTYRSGPNGQPQQVVHAHRPFALPVVDLTSLPADAREAEAERLVMAEATTCFDLGADLLLRARLIRLAADDHILVLVSHHIVSDGWSKGILFRELSAAYDALSAGRAPALAPLPIQYADFAIWQRAAAEGPELREHLDYWRGRLAQPLPTLELPTDFPRPAAQGFAGSRRDSVLPNDLVARLRELGQSYGATPYMVLLAAYQTVLHRYSGQADIITGSPIAGRTRPEVEGLLGYFANTLAMRTSFADDPTFAELLERISENAVDAYEHEAVPFEELVLELRAADAPGTPSHAPLFSCVLRMEDTLPDELRLGAASLEFLSLDIGQTKFDLTLLVAEVPQGLRLALGFRTDLFMPGYAERFLGHVRSVLEAAVADAEVRVSKIALLTAGERAQLAAWNDTAAALGAPATLVESFEAQAARVPERAAVVGADATLSYAELNARANALARQLRSLGVSSNTPVGLLLDRSAEAVVGLLGILKAGGAYMPLSVEAPAGRLATQLTESGAKVVVTDAAGAGKLPASVQAVTVDASGASSDANVDSVAAPDDLVYVLYTSGSTGTPKGVAVTHANAVHYARTISRVLGALDGLHFGMVSTLAADLGNTALLPSLIAGGTLHVLSKDVTTDPARFAEYVAAHPLDVIKATPNHVVALGTALPTTWLVVGGEALRPEVARTFLNAGTCRVLNHYGPTETTVGVLTHEVTTASLSGQTVPLGKPLANTHAYVVDAHGNEQPVGIPGELLIGGAGVARGYLKRDDLTAERFVAFHGERVYRTGDRVKRLPDGSIEFLGRVDDQVKVRGFRVELGEIEQVLRANPGVAQAVVVLRDEALVAYAVPKQAGYAVSHSDRPTREKLVEWLAAQLPEYMVPSAVVLLDALPLTPNGKVDKRALPAPDASAAAADTYVAPRTPTEGTVARIWQDVLKKERIGVTESFLDLGGHSLLAIRVLGRINKELGVRLALRALFETPTVTQIAAIVDTELRAREEAELARALAEIEGLSDEQVRGLTTGAGEAKE